MNFLKGIFIGIALVIPGLSGSMFAVVVGLYDSILEAVGGFLQKPGKALGFLWPILLGIFVGIAISTKAVLWLCLSYPTWAYCFFIGLVLVGIPMALSKCGPKRSLSYGGITLAAFIAILVLSQVTNMGTGTDGAQSIVAIEAIKGMGNWLTVFAAGLISCSLMAIPGVSGSVTLMVLGQYGTVYHAVSKCLDMTLQLARGHWDVLAALGQSVWVLIPFILGAILGLICIARALSWLLKHYQAQVYYGVLGLMLGSAAALLQQGVWPHLEADLAYFGSMVTVLIAAVCVGVGAGCTLLFDNGDPEPKAKSIHS